MSIIFKISKNITASLIYHIEQELITDGLNSTWTVLPDFKRAYSTVLPVITVRNGIMNSTFAEIGSTNVTKYFIIAIDIFARNDNERFEIKDWLFDALRNGCDFFEHTAETDGEIQRILNGKIITLSLDEEQINVNTDLSNLVEHDRYRYRLNLTVTTGRVL